MRGLSHILGSLVLLAIVIVVLVQPALVEPGYAMKPLEAPEVTTLEAQDVTTDSALLRASLDSMGSAAHVTVSFEWGTDKSYGNELMGPGVTGPLNCAAHLFGLSPATTYHFRAKAVGQGTSHGEDMAFTTGISIAPKPTDLTPPRRTPDPEDVAGDWDGEPNADIAFLREAKR